VRPGSELTWARSTPVVLVVDNAQWMDEASQTLLQTLAQQVCGTAPVLQLGSGPFSESLTVEKALELVGRLAAGKSVADLTSTPEKESGR